MEAQRYPDDFDGIVAGAPAYDFTGIAVQFIKDIQAAFPDKESLSKPLFSERHVEERRDADRRRSATRSTASTDGLMEDPRRMHGRRVDADRMSDPQKKRWPRFTARRSCRTAA